MNQQANLETCGVSDHAIAQFQARIARLDDMSARRVIRDGIQSAENVLTLPDGNTLRVRTRRPFPFEFRAFCVFDNERGHFVVTTIVRGDSNVTRARRRTLSERADFKGNVTRDAEVPGAAVKKARGANESA